MTDKTIDPRIFGQRLAEARKARGMTQEGAALHIGYSRPTYIAIEKGERTAKPEEIVKLAALFGKQVHELLLQAEPITVLSPHLRGEIERINSGNAELVRKQLGGVIEDFQNFLDQYRELERLMNAPLRSKLPDVRDLGTHVDAGDQAEDIATQERQRLGLGDQPIINLRATLETEVGLRIFYGDLPSSVAGVYDFVTAMGCCLYINRKHPPERRRVSMGHEYGHAIVDRHKPGIDYLFMQARKPPNERFADAFAAAFLMPATSVRRRFVDIVNTTGDFQVANLCRLAHAYFVSVPAMAYRLENLGLVPKGRADLLKELKLPVGQAKERLRLSPHPVNEDPYPERYKALAVYAYQQEKISEGQLARFLHCDRVSAREIVQEYLTSRDVNDDGKAETVQFDQTQQSLIRATT